MLWTDILGWVGAVGFLASYVLASNGRLDPRSRGFQWLNVVAAALFVVSSATRRAWPSAGLNLIWIGIGMVALWRLRVGSPERSSAAASPQPELSSC